MAPVLLFDMGIVVLLVWSRSGKLHSWFVVGEVPYQVMVEELRAVVTIEPLKLKRQVSFDIPDPFDNTVSPNIS